MPPGFLAIDLIHKSHNATAPYPTMHHLEQKCAHAHFCSKWCIVGYGTDALWDLWDAQTGLFTHHNGHGQCTDINTRHRRRAVLGRLPGCTWWQWWRECAPNLLHYHEHPKIINIHLDFYVAFVETLNKLLNKQLNCQWFKMHQH